MPIEDYRLKLLRSAFESLEFETIIRDASPRRDPMIPLRGELGIIIFHLGSFDKDECLSEKID